MPTITTDFDHAVSASVLSDGRVVLYERLDRMLDVLDDASLDEAPSLDD